jgi:hypothetical protein
MKKFFLVLGFLAACSGSDEGIERVKISDAVNQAGPYLGQGGGDSGGSVCENKEEVREVVIDGNVHYLIIPVLCTDEWQEPSDPSSDELDIIFEVDQGNNY